MENELDIRYCLVEFKLQFVQKCNLPVHKTSAIRGGIGQMLLKDFCIKDERCESCDFRRECLVQRTLYSHFDNKPAYVTSGDSVGYVLNCMNEQSSFNQGDSLSFYLLLFGNTCLYLPVFIRAVKFLGKRGLGKDKAQFELISVMNETGEQIWNGIRIYNENIQINTVSDYVSKRKNELNQSADDILIDFVTPLTIKYNREFITYFNMDAIIRAVQRRINILDYYENIDGEDAYKKRIYFSGVKSQTVRKSSQKRYSNRKDQAMWLNGIKGSVCLENVPDEVLDLLIVGELIHIGKNTSFGFGKYMIR